MRNVIIFVVSFLIWQAIQIQAYQAELTEAQKQEMYAMVADINRASMVYRATIMQKMLKEANYFASRLNLPTTCPIRATDVKYPFVAQPWFGVIRDERTVPNVIVSRFGTNIFNSNIPREQRLQALEIGTSGSIETTNFQFIFYNGRLREVMRLSEHEVEYCANDLGKLVGKPSLIDTNDAYQLATQWLAAVDVDMVALQKLKWTINQLHYRERGTTNYVTLPLYYVDFGLKHYAATNNLKAFDEPLVSVEILGTTKELQDLEISDLAFSQRPLLFITNVLELVQAADPKMKQLERPAVP